MDKTTKFFQKQKQDQSWELRDLTKQEIESMIQDCKKTHAEGRKFFQEHLGNKNQK